MASRSIDIDIGSDMVRAVVTVPPSGAGPGILLFHEDDGHSEPARALAELYAEEGYVVLSPDFAGGAREALNTLIDTLRNLHEVNGGLGALGFGEGGAHALAAAADGGVDCAATYYGIGLAAVIDQAETIPCPVVFHFAAADPAAATIPASFETAFPEGYAQAYLYPAADKAAASLAHSRTLAVFRRVLGPRFDLEKIFDRHTELEFGIRDADATMATMVAEPYVNHVPVMTGGTGFTETLRFYRHHFVPTTPPDASMVLISRTIGADRMVDEMVFSFTHNNEIDWMLPGIPPTGKRVEVPLVAIVHFRGDKIHSEHIYWDQASVLVQVGLLDPKLYPVAGRATALKVLDETRPSNTLMGRWRESEPKGAAKA